MNALGLTYGSSDEEEDAGQQQQRAPPPPVAAGDCEGAEDAEGDELEAALARAGIPGEPPGRPDAAIQERIRKFLAQSDARHGGGFQESLRAKRDVGNPYILEKVVAHFGIDELQTHFAPRVFDPRALPLHEYGDELALAQKRKSEARQRRQLQQAQQLGQVRQLQFTRGGAN